MSVSINRPFTNEPAAVVLSTGSGVICAWGEVGATRLASSTIRIDAKIYPAAATDDPQPFGIPGVQSVFPPGNYWYFPALAGATCNQGPYYPKLKLKVWSVDVGAGTGVGTVLGLPALQPFMGRCANKVDCGWPYGSGTHGAAGGMAAGFGAGVAAGAVAILSAAPVQWLLLADAFLRPEHTPFNSRWLLRLRQTLTGHCVWDNGGDGVTSPLVELRCEGPAFAHWQLHFRHGALAVRYTKPSHEWACRGPNSLTEVADGNGGRAALPASLTLIPD